MTTPTSNSPWVRIMPCEDLLDKTVEEIDAMIAKHCEVKPAGGRGRSKREAAYIKGLLELWETRRAIEKRTKRIDLRSFVEQYGK